MGTSEALLPTVTLRPMTEQEYDDYRQRSVPAYAADLERARSAPRATADVIPNAGHWVHVDAPDTLRELVLGYLGPPKT